jgi:anti-sigma B factor antagonist
MNISEKKNNGFCILYIEGIIDSEKVHDFEKAVIGVIDRGENHLIVNCKELKYISSIGLRVFLIAQKRIIAVKGKMYLCEFRPAVLQTVVISGFSSIFRIFETEDEALQA